MLEQWYGVDVADAVLGLGAHPSLPLPSSSLPETWYGVDAFHCNGMLYGHDQLVLLSHFALELVPLGSCTVWESSLSMVEHE